MIYVIQSIVSYKIDTQVWLFIIIFQIIRLSKF